MQTPAKHRRLRAFSCSRNGRLLWLAPILFELTHAVAAEIPGENRPPITQLPAGELAATTSTLEAFVPRPVADVLEAQIFLARRGLSPGPIDGLNGPQTRAALRAFQEQYGLPVTGELDETTRRPMRLTEAPLTDYIVTAHDLARLRPVPTTWLGKSQAERLDYETVLELVAEHGWAYQSYIRRLNPQLDWSAITAGTSVRLPRVEPPQFSGKAAQVKIFLERRTLQAFDQEGRLLVHFPCSVAVRVDKRPIGELHVSVLAPDPDYTFDPELFTESEEGRQLGRRLRLPPGPNNPVGVVWLGLNLPGYGIHGTPRPENVGRAESLGCFRLANWNARILLDLAWVGLPVIIEP